MLKNRFSFSRLMRPVLLGIAALALAACEGSYRGPTSSIDPTQPVVVAMMVPYGSGQAANDQLADNLVNAANMATRDLQGAVIDLRIYQTGADPVRAATELNALLPRVLKLSSGLCSAAQPARLRLLRGLKGLMF